MELYEYDFPVYVAIDLIVLLFILIITAVKIFQRCHCQLLELRSDSRAIADPLTAKIGNDIEKGFKSNLISSNILYNLMHCCLCFSFLCDVSLLFIFYHSPYDFNVTYDSLIKKIKTVETELLFDSGNFFVQRL